MPTFKEIRGCTLMISVNLVRNVCLFALSIIYNFAIANTLFIHVYMCLRYAYFICIKI